MTNFEKYREEDGLINKEAIKQDNKNIETVEESLDYFFRMLEEIIKISIDKLNKICYT